MAWKDLVKELEKLGKMSASVGWHPTAKYPDGTPVAMVATVMEYGNVKKRVPPRPTVRPTIAEKGKVWSQHAGQGIKAVAEGKITPFALMDLLGGEAAGDVRMAIADLTTPPLSEVTKAIRKRMGYKPDKPLVRSSLMLTTCVHEVTQ